MAKRKSGKGKKAVVTPKRECCHSSPRCKRCPVVMRRLARQGYATRIDERSYVLAPGLRKKLMKAARS